MNVMRTGSLLFSAWRILRDEYFVAYRSVNCLSLKEEKSSQHAVIERDSARIRSINCTY